MQKTFWGILALALLLILLAACGGSAEDTAVEVAPAEEAPSEAMEGEEEALEEVEEAEETEEEPPSAIGSEDGSGALPPPINSGSKVTPTPSGQGKIVLVDILFLLELADDTAVITDELEETWDAILSQIEALPIQPQVRYAKIIAQQNETLQIVSSDFDVAPASLTTDIETYKNSTFFTNSLTEEITQLSWNEAESLQIIFVIGTQNLVDDVEMIDLNTAVIYPITTQETVPVIETTPHPYQSIAEETNGHLIQLNPNTTLAEQIIIATDQKITESGE